MSGLALSPIAPVLGQRIPLRGPPRLLYRSYARHHCPSGILVRKVTTQLGDDFSVDMSSWLEWQLWAFGGYEEHLGQLFGYLVADGDRCIDVGANIGIHTVRLAKLAGARGSVTAIEASEELVARARSNCELNKLSNVRLIHAAASSRGGDSIRLYQPGAGDPNKGRASVKPHEHLTGPSRLAPTVAIDDLAQEPVSLIKIDVEGAEEAVIAGARKVISTYSPVIIFEYDPELLTQEPGGTFRWLREQGYQLFDTAPERHPVTGRRHLRLESLRGLPHRATDILAASESSLGRVGQFAGHGFS